MTSLRMTDKSGFHRGRVERNRVVCSCGWVGAWVGDDKIEADRRFSTHLVIRFGGADPWPWRDGQSRISNPRFRSGDTELIYDPRPIGSWKPGPLESDIDTSLKGPTS